MTELRDCATACVCEHVEELHRGNQCLGLVQSRGLMRLWGAVHSCDCRRFKPKDRKRWWEHANAQYWAGSRKERPRASD